MTTTSPPKVLSAYVAITYSRLCSTQPLVFGKLSASSHPLARTRCSHSYRCCARCERDQTSSEATTHEPYLGKRRNSPRYRPRLQSVRMNLYTAFPILNRLVSTNAVSHRSGLPWRYRQSFTIESVLMCYCCSSRTRGLKCLPLRCGHLSNRHCTQIHAQEL